MSLVALTVKRAFMQCNIHIYPNYNSAESIMFFETHLYMLMHVWESINIV